MGHPWYQIMTVCRWVRKFKADISSMKAAPKHICYQKKNVSAIRELVEDGRYIIEEIASKVGISEGSVHTILNKNLGMKKVSACWVLSWTRKIRVD